MDQTNPETGVSEDHSVEHAVNRLVQSQDQAPEVTEQPQSSNPPETAEQAQAKQEPTPEDIQDEVEQPAIDAFEIEIVHDGQQHKLSREDAIKYAMQGFDYTQKTQEVAAQKRTVAQQLQALTQAQQVHPQLLQERAQVEGLRGQLEQFRNFNWIKLAQDDPMGYPAVRAQYDVLAQAYQDASATYQQHEHAFKNHIGQVRQQQIQAEDARVPDFIPEWKDAQKRAAGEQQLAKHYEAQYGVSFEELSASLNGSALAMATAYKAMKYDQLLKSKSEKVKQLRTAPPVTVPGAKSGSVKSDQEKQLRDKLRRSGSMDDAAALLLNRMT